jgi:cell shape-determining protein MreC
MKNPLVQRMYNTLQEATDKVMLGVQIQQNLYQEVSQLKAEVKELQKIWQDSL